MGVKALELSEVTEDTEDVLPVEARLLHGDDLLARVRRVAPDIANTNSRNFSAEAGRKDLRVEPIPDVGRLDVGGKVLDEEAGLDDEANFRRVNIPLASGRIRPNGIRFFAEPCFDVDDGSGPDHDDRVALVCADDNVGEIVHVHIDAAAQRVPEGPDVLEGKVLGRDDLIRGRAHLNLSAHVDEDLAVAFVGCADDDVIEAVVVQVAGIGDREPEPEVLFGKVINRTPNVKPV